MSLLGKIKKLNCNDKKIRNIVVKGIEFSFIFCLFASYILITYIASGNVLAYDIGIEMTKTGLFYLVCVIICGIGFNQIKKDWKPSKKKIKIK